MDVFRELRPVLQSCKPYDNVFLEDCSTNPEIRFQETHSDMEIGWVLHVKQYKRIPAAESLGSAFHESLAAYGSVEAPQHGRLVNTVTCGVLRMLFVFAAA
jgi:hypothetical protein